MSSGKFLDDRCKITKINEGEINHLRDNSSLFKIYASKRTLLCSMEIYSHQKCFGFEIVDDMRVIQKKNSLKIDVYLVNSPKYN